MQLASPARSLRLLLGLLPFLACGTDPTDSLGQGGAGMARMGGASGSVARGGSVSKAGGSAGHATHQGGAASGAGGAEDAGASGIDGSPAGGGSSGGRQSAGGSETESGGSPQQGSGGKTGAASGGESGGTSPETLGGAGGESGGASDGGASDGGASDGGASDGGTSGRGWGGTSGQTFGGNPGAGSGGRGGQLPLGCAGPVCGPSYEAFYDNESVATLRVYIEGEDLAGHAPEQWLDLLWSKWKHCAPFDNLVRARIEYESDAGVFEMGEVGMRLRGSRQQRIQGFKLDFQKLLGPATGPARRRFADINRLNVLSNEDDDSFLIQCLAYKTLRRFGVEAPRCNHLRVYVNDQFYGLLQNIEEADHGRYLRHHFGTSEGLLVEASPSSPTCGFVDGKADLEYNGDTFTGLYPEAYKIERGTPEDAERTLLPMLHCGDSDTTPDDAEFRECISEWLDVDQWLRVIAFESLTPELQSFIGYKRNYYLYFHPDDTSLRGGRFLVHPWDLDMAFHRQRCFPGSCDPFRSVDSTLAPRGKRPALVTRLTSVFRTEYCATMERFLNEIYDPSLLDEMARVIEPEFLDNPTVAAEAWQAEILTLRTYIEEHRVAALSQVTSLCAQ